MSTQRDRRPEAWRRRSDDGWPEDRVALLLRLHAEGLGPTEIGLRLGVSKNAVIGKRERLGLPPRKRLPHRQGMKLAVPVDRGAGGLAEARRRSLAPTPPPVAAKPAPRPATGPVTGPVGTVRACQFITGERPHWTMCNAPAVPGRSWCRECLGRVFVRMRSSEWAP